jgi:hypothetical protein
MTLAFIMLVSQEEEEEEKIPMMNPSEMIILHSQNG